MRSWAADLLYHWFTRLDPTDWFSPTPEIDAELERRFARWITPLKQRPPRDFLEGPRETLAAILLFDQVPRNVFRGEGRAFGTDPLARALTRAMMQRGWDMQVRRGERAFVYMPLMHSEKIADQRLSVAAFAKLGNSTNLRFARDHARTIYRFGRFPHRNEVLGRETSAAERRAIDGGADWS